MRAGRLISLVSILSREGRATVATLAERLEVSERTILRDLEVLSGSGVPVYADARRGWRRAAARGLRPHAARPTPGSGRPRPGRRPRRMTVRVTAEGRRIAAILGYLQPLRVRPEPPRTRTTAG